MQRYTCDDGNAEIEIEADTAEEAAQEYVDGGDWGGGNQTIWVDVRVAEIVEECEHRMGEPTGPDAGRCLECGAVCSCDEDDGDNQDCPIHGQGSPREWETITVTLEPDEPKCSSSDGHRWAEGDELYARVGGLPENPGVWGHGGGVVSTDVCLRCGLRRETDTWAQRPDTGEQGLRSVKYHGEED